MAQTIVLYNDDLSLSLVLTDDKADLSQAGFVIKKAQVMSGQWIVYSNAQFNPMSNGKSQLLTEGPQGIITLDFLATSCRHVPTFSAHFGVSIYQHGLFGGRVQEVYDSAASIDVGGASSIIVSGGNWKMFLKPNFVGASKGIGPGLYPSLPAMGFPNDKLQSISRGH